MLPGPAMQTPPRLAVDRTIAALDARLSAVLDAILHHPRIQQLESQWRAIHMLVTRTRPHSGVRVELLACTRTDLAADLARPDLEHSGLHHHLYARACASFGGQPYGLVCLTHAFGPDDLGLLRPAVALAALAHAPLLADADPALLGLLSHTEIPHLRDLPVTQQSPRFTAWHAFRTGDDARWLALCLPRFLLRPPHDLAAAPTARLRYSERVRSHADLVWGPAAVLVALRAAEAFADQRWCVGLLGTRSGPELVRLGDNPCTLEVLLPPRSERALADLGLVPVTADRLAGRAILRHAPTVQRAADPLAAQLPYVFLISRLAHYLRRIQREHIGQWDDRAALQRLLDHWLRRLVADMDDPPPEVRAVKPLRSASVTLTPAPDDAGWYRCHLRVVPHLTHLGRPLTLDLVGRLDRS
ncbi:MAG: type VI secretion system contractile sheath large subunit [Myxococcales bacterium]|nr:type VI secretion system contractile sheath large subunit [Myxococcales bacterium]